MSVRRVLGDHAASAAAAATDGALVTALESAAARIVASLDAGGRIYACGNGGSAADAQHLVAELVGRFVAERSALPAVALAADAAVLTSIANDFGFEQVFARQLEGPARPIDVVVCISTSGRSPNVVAAAEAARRIGCGVIALVGAAPGPLEGVADVVVRVPSTDVQRIQELHAVCIHALVEAVEGALSDR